MDCNTPGFPVYHQFLEPAQTHVHWVDDAIQPSYPLLSPSLLPSVFPSIRVFSNVSALRIRWPKCWSLSFSTSLSNEYSRLVSFRMNWLDLFSSPRDSQESPPTPQFKSSILQHSTFFMVQLSHPNLTTGKTIALNRWTFVDKVMSLPFNMLSRFVIAFFQEANVF